MSIEETELQVDLLDFEDQLEGVFEVIPNGEPWIWGRMMVIPVKVRK